MSSELVEIFVHFRPRVMRPRLWLAAISVVQKPWTEFQAPGAPVSDTGNFQAESVNVIFQNLLKTPGTSYTCSSG
jgi:hypothetical protein